LSKGLGPLGLGAGLLIAGRPTIPQVQNQVGGRRDAIGCCTGSCCSFASLLDCIRWFLLFHLTIWRPADLRSLIFGALAVLVLVPVPACIYIYTYTHSGCMPNSFAAACTAICSSAALPVRPSKPGQAFAFSAVDGQQTEKGLL
jgi:hypothetical protein